jgi:hypothetical protein
MTTPRGLFLLSLAAFFQGCPPPDPPPPPPPTPPQVFLTVTESNVIGSSVKGKVNVSGCKNVAQVQLLQGDSFLSDLNYTKSPTDFELAPGLFSALYSRLGIAASLTLKAKVVCDDGRTNNSQPVGVKFFPIANRFTEATGQQIVPDNFVAEGGLGGSANTFLGCVGTSTGTTIARVDRTGQVLNYIQSMPFPCSLATQISDLSTVTGTRWVLEPGAGAFAIKNSTLEIQKELRDAKTSRMGVGVRGSAVIWIDESGRSRVHKLDPVTSAINDWTYPSDFITPVRLYGIMNSTPVIDDGAGAVWISEWRFDMGSRTASIIPFKLNLYTGALLNGQAQLQGSPASIHNLTYPQDITSQPIVPEGVFNADGSFFTLPAIALNAQTTTVLSCSTGLGLCEGTARRWSSTQFPGILRAIVPYSQGNILAVIGPYSVWFLSAQLGTVMNLGEVPIVPTGSLLVVGVQPGLGTDFYVLTGPDLGAGNASFAMEIIGIDSPGAGELWRLEYGSGESSGNAMWIGIDDAQAVWIRAGTDLIKPLSNSEYRMARGPTVIP